MVSSLYSHASVGLMRHIRHMHLFISVIGFKTQMYKMFTSWFSFFLSFINTDAGFFFSWNKIQEKATTSPAIFFLSSFVFITILSSTFDNIFGFVGGTHRDHFVQKQS